MFLILFRLLQYEPTTIKHSGLKKEVNGPVLAQARQGYRRDGTTTEIAINKDSVEEHS